MDVLPLVAKTSLHRSPNAATYILQECLEGAPKVSRVEEQVATSRESASENLSLAPQSGFFNQKLRSLRHYGHLEAIRKYLRIGDLFRGLSTRMIKRNVVARCVGRWDAPPYSNAFWLSTNRRAYLLISILLIN